MNWWKINIVFLKHAYEYFSYKNKNACLFLENITCIEVRLIVLEKHMLHIVQKGSHCDIGNMFLPVDRESYYVNFLEKNNLLKRLFA